MVPFSTEIVICVLDVSLDFHIVRSSNERLTFRSGCGSHITQEKMFLTFQKGHKPKHQQQSKQNSLLPVHVRLRHPQVLDRRLMGNSSLIFFGSC